MSYRQKILLCKPFFFFPSKKIRFIRFKMLTDLNLKLAKLRLLQQLCGSRKIASEENCPPALSLTLIDGRGRGDFPRGHLYGHRSIYIKIFTFLKLRFFFPVLSIWKLLNLVFSCLFNQLTPRITDVWEVFL